MASQNDNADFEAHHYARKLADEDFPPQAAETLGRIISEFITAARTRWEEQVKYVDTENLIRILENYAKRQEEFIGTTAAGIIAAAVEKKNFTETVRAFRAEFATKEDLAKAVENLEQAIATQSENTATQVRAEVKADLHDTLGVQTQKISDRINELQSEQSRHHVSQIRWVAGTAIAIAIAIAGVIVAITRMQMLQ